MGVDRIREQWEENATAFADLVDGRGTPHHREILNPCVERLLGDIRNKRLLDAGCGEGYLSLHYARLGAIVSGVDISPSLLHAARSAAEEENIEVEFREGDVCRLADYQDESFDFVLCNLVLLNVPCFEDAIRQFARVLRRGGSLVVSLVHPAFDFYGPGQWEMGEKDPKTGRRRGRQFVMDNYFVEMEYERYWKKRDGTDFPSPISFFHRTMSTYVRAMSSAGLWVDAIEEPLPPPDDDFFERERRIPFFLVFRAVKR